MRLCILSGKVSFVGAAVTLATENTGETKMESQLAKEAEERRKMESLKADGQSAVSAQVQTDSSACCVVFCISKIALTP